MDTKIIEKIRQPEYTGENRCEPCTVLNLVLAGIFSSAVARKSRIGGYVALAVAVALIYVRGYLIPGTPTLTKRYLPSTVLRWFGKEPTSESRRGLAHVSEVTSDVDDTGTRSVVADHEGGEAGIDPHDFLLREGVVEPCEEEDDLCLNDEFSRGWNEKLDALTEKKLNGEQAASILGVSADGGTFEVDRYGDAWTLRSGSDVIGQWPSETALLADVGAAQLLEDWSDRWENLTPAQRGQILNGLRMFLEQCPDGGGSVSMDQETVESCCSSHEVVTVSCNETGERLFEQQLS